MDGTQSAKRCRVDEGTCIMCASRAPLSELSELSKPKDSQSIYNQFLMLPGYSTLMPCLISVKMNLTKNYGIIGTVVRPSLTIKPLLPSHLTKHLLLILFPLKSCREGPSSSRVMEQICIFCDKKDKSHRV